MCRRLFRAAMYAKLALRSTRRTDVHTLAFALCCVAVAPAMWYVPAGGLTSHVAVAVWALLAFSLALTARRLTVALMPQADTLHRALAAVVLWCGLATCIVSYLGYGGHFSVAAQCVVVGIVGCIAAVMPPSDARPRRPIPARLEPDAGWLGRSALVFGTLACGVVALNSIRYIPTDSDNMWYHLPMVAEWIRTGSIWPAASIPLIARAYPGFGESLTAFLSCPVRSEHLACIGALQRPLLGISLYAAMRALRVSNRAAIPIVVYAVTIPGAIVEGNDVVLALTFLWAIVFLQQIPSRGGAVVGGIALGCLASTKYSGVIYAAVVVGMCGVARIIAARTADGSRGISRTIKHFLLAGAVAALIMWPWYVRNLVVFGNPVYPAPVHIGGWLHFDGAFTADYFRSRTLGWNLAPLVANRHLFVDIFGMLAPVAAAAPIAWVALVAVRARSARGWLWAALCPLCFIIYLHQPFTYERPYNVGQLRYLHPWFCASIIVAAASVSQRGLFAVLAAAVAFVGAVANVAAWTHGWWMMLVVALAAPLAGVLVKRIGRAAPRWLHGGVTWPRVVALYAAIVAIGAGLDVVRTRLRYTPYGYSDNASALGWGPVSSYVHQNLKGERIAVTGDLRFFPLYGDGFENAVVRYDAAHADPEALASFCTDHRATYLVCFRPSTRTARDRFTFGESAGPAMLADFPHGFHAVFERDGAYVPQVVPDGLAERGKPLASPHAPNASAPRPTDRARPAHEPPAKSTPPADETTRAKPQARTPLDVTRRSLSARPKA